MLVESTKFFYCVMHLLYKAEKQPFNPSALFHADNSAVSALIEMGLA